MILVIVLDGFDVHVGRADHRVLHDPVDAVTHDTYGDHRRQQQAAEEPAGNLLSYEKHAGLHNWGNPRELGNGSSSGWNYTPLIVQRKRPHTERQRCCVPVGLGRDGLSPRTSQRELRR